MGSMRAWPRDHDLFRSGSDLAGLDCGSFELFDRGLFGLGWIEDVVVYLLDRTGDAHSLLGSQ